MSIKETLGIFGIEVNRLTYETFLREIGTGISEKRKTTIGYANANTLNKIYESSTLKNIYNTFDIIHPDGIGIFLALRLFYGKDGLHKRLTGSDFYPLLINDSIKHNWKYFFFGHTEEILNEIHKNHPLLNIAGINEGYSFDNSKVIEKINEADPDILILGLSCPVQEEWIFNNKDKISCKVILAVGDGIKVFAGRKIRGPLLFQKLGMEWFFRLISDPSSNFSKYFTGVPLFIFRVLKSKLNLK